MASINPVELSIALNQLNKKIQGELEEERASRFTFDPEVEVEYDGTIIDDISELEDKIKKYGYGVEVTEDLDIKDASKTEKFNIKISKGNESFVIIKMSDYKKIMLDYTLSEEEYIEKELEKIGGVNIKNISSISKLICEYISYACYFTEIQVKLYNDMGWAEYNREQIFKYDRIYTITNSKNSEIISRCKNSIVDDLHSPRINPLQDSYDKLEWVKEFLWVYSYRNKATGKPYNALILAAACTGLIRPLLPFTKENNININIVGERASGKSTICHYALSVFGNPEQLEGSFVDSDEAAEIIRVKRPVIPYILDERMLKVENESERVKRQKVLMNVFREYEGKVKERMAGSDKELSGQRTYAPLISSSVEPMMNLLLQVGQDLGQYRRFIELYIKKNELFEDKKMAQYVEKLAYAKYGYGVEIMVQFILDNFDTESIQELYNSILYSVNKALEEREEEERKLGNNSVTGLGSSAMRFSLILTALTIMEKAVKQYVVDQKEKIELDSKNEIKRGFSDLLNYCSDNEPVENIVKDVLELLIDNLVDKMKKVHLKFDIRKNLIEFYDNHKGLFAKGPTELSNHKDEFLGFRKDERNGDITFGFLRDKGLEWVAASDEDNKTDEEILEYIKKIRDPEMKDSEKIKIIRENIGEYANRDITSAIFEKDKKQIIVEKVTLGGGGGNGITITLVKDNIEAEDLDDSDAEEKTKKTTKAKNAKEETK